MFEVFNTTSSKVILAIAIIIIVVFQVHFWKGEGGYFPHQTLLEKMQSNAKINEELKERNRILAAEVYDLKNGAEAIEEHARLDLGLIKPHETFVQMSTISTQYQPIYIDTDEDVDTRTNEDDIAPEQP